MVIYYSLYMYYMRCMGGLCFPQNNGSIVIVGGHSYPVNNMYGMLYGSEIHLLEKHMGQDNMACSGLIPYRSMTKHA